MDTLTTLLVNIVTSEEFAALLVTVIGIVATTVVGLVGKALRDFLNAKLTAEQMAFLGDIARAAVYAAEQTGIGAVAAEKKAAAIAYANSLLAGAGIKVSAEQIEAAIEAAVFEELNRWNPPAEEPSA